MPSEVSSSVPTVQGVTPKRSEWDYRLAMTVLTVLAFITRFYKISYPNEVVFDEVHFGKVSPVNIREPPVGPIGLTMIFPVRFLLPATHLLLRCPPSLRQASFRLYGLVGGL